MKLDPAELRAEAEAHRQRMESPLWTPLESAGQDDALWTDALSVGPEVDEGTPPLRQAAPVMSAAVPPSRRSPPIPEVAAHAEAAALEILPRLEAIDRAVEKLSAAVSRRPAGRDDVPAWLQTAAGDPHTYDAPDSDRTGVCVRILPTTYQHIQRAQRQMGLRTTAGAWEFLLRLGIAALERLPAH